MTSEEFLVGFLLSCGTGYLLQPLAAQILRWRPTPAPRRPIARTTPPVPPAFTRPTEHPPTPTARYLRDAGKPSTILSSGGAGGTTHYYDTRAYEDHKIAWGGNKIAWGGNHIPGETPLAYWTRLRDAGVITTHQIPRIADPLRDITLCTECTEVIRPGQPIRHLELGGIAHHYHAPTEKWCGCVWHVNEDCPNHTPDELTRYRAQRARRRPDDLDGVDTMNA